MTAYYNEWVKEAAAWLRELIQLGLIPAGDVDTRSIADVRADDLVGYGQCHFFAGIGGWPLALRLAGWSDAWPVWSGSCPCQPFSEAGKRTGTADERHLWPEFRRLIAQRRPAIVFGEQVASQAGRAWLAAVRADLEALGYAAGGGAICAQRASVLPRSGSGSSGWQTPTTRDGKGQSGLGNRTKRGRNGRLHVANLCDQIVDLGRPDLVRSTSFRNWLMGYPESWEGARATAMQSSRKSPKHSSKL